MSKCPKCEKVITHVNHVDLTIHALTKRVTGNGYACPLCQTIISVEVDPIAIKTDTLNAIRKMLGG